MLRKLIKAAQDKLTGKKDKQAPVPAPPPPPKVELKTAPQKPPEIKAQSERPPYKPGGYQQSRQRRRPAPQNRPPSPFPRTDDRNASVSRWDPSQFQVAPAEGKTRFHDLGLPPEIMHGISDIGFEYCTPIQAAILPKTLSGADASGKAQTGTGKTAAFLITILAQLKRSQPVEERHRGVPRALIMAPTRELAMQITKEANLLGKYCRFKVVAVFGGMDYQRQMRTLAENVIDIVVATPGRLLDFKNQGIVHLGKVEILVIDEADEMLNMGFIPDIRKIVNSTPPKAKRQTMLFGATLTPEVNRLASQWTHNPVTVDIHPEQVAIDTVKQVVYLIKSRERFTLLYNLVTQQNLKRVLVFCNRRDQTRILADRLKAHGISCAVLSGEIAQKQRIRTVEDFRDGRITVMVSTDVAGRGIHIEDISHVVNYNLPLDAEDYVHRIGRTGRAGSAGTSISFATEDESYLLPAIEEYLTEKLHCVYPADELLNPVPPPAAAKPYPTATKAPAPGDSTQPRSQAPRRRRPRNKNNSTGRTNYNQPPRATPPDAPK
ncbi:MAG: DEAD/DEAH box helicase [Dehalococcoidia bacterium]